MDSYENDLNKRDRVKIKLSHLVLDPLPSLMVNLSLMGEIQKDIKKRLYNNLEVDLAGTSWHYYCSKIKLLISSVMEIK